MNKIKISVIIPIYGVENYIEICLKSIFTQTRINGVEFILVNDATNDNSMVLASDIITLYPQLDIKIINHSENKGLASARQSGVDIANGEYIMHIDSDDWYEPTMLEDLYTVAKENNADIVICDLYKNYLNRDIYIKQSVSDDPLQSYDYVLRSVSYPSIWNKLIKRSYLIDNNIKSIPNINMGEDLLLTTQLLCNGNPKICHQPKAYAHYCIRDSSYVGQMSERSLVDLISGMSIIESIIEKTNNIERFTQGIICRKLHIKLKCLQFSTRDTQKSYALLYPETGQYIYTHLSAKLPYKFALKQAASGRLYLFNAVLFIIKFLHKIKR